MRLFGFERRWFVTLIEAIYPEAHGIRLTAPLEGFADALVQRAPTRVALGIRLATWILTLAGPLLAGRLATMGSLAQEDRARVLVRLSESRIFLLRELPVLLKTMGAMGVFGMPDVQRQLGVERLDTTPPDWARQ